MEGSLTSDERTFIWKIRGLRSWIPDNSVRPDCLLLPGNLPESGLQGGGKVEVSFKEIKIFYRNSGSDF